MGKNNRVFDKTEAPVQGDPVAEAQAQAQAADQSQGEEQQEQSVLADLVQQPATTAASEQPAPEQPVAEVQETTQEKPAPVTQPTIIAKRDNGKAGVQRPTGAAPRETSPAVTSVGAQPVSAQFGALIAKERKEGTANAQHLIVFLDNYVSTMRPRKITPVADILQMQEGLHDVLVSVIEKAPSKEFNRLWRIAIAYVREYKDACFSPLYCNRGAREWKRDPQQFNVLSSLLNLLVASANDLNTVGSEVNVNLVANKGFSEEGRGRLINFYMK